jgi:hypothetical protein
MPTLPQCWRASANRITRRQIRTQSTISDPEQRNILLFCKQWFTSITLTFTLWRAGHASKILSHNTYKYLATVYKNSSWKIISTSNHAASIGFRKIIAPTEHAFRRQLSVQGPMQAAVQLSTVCSTRNSHWSLRQVQAAPARPLCVATTWLPPEV